VAHTHKDWEQLLSSKKAGAVELFRELSVVCLHESWLPHVRKVVRAYFDHVRADLDACEQRGRDFLKN